MAFRQTAFSIAGKLYDEMTISHNTSKAYTSQLTLATPLWLLTGLPGTKKAYTINTTPYSDVIVEFLDLARSGTLTMESFVNHDAYTAWTTLLCGSKKGSSIDADQLEAYTVASKDITQLLFDILVGHSLNLKSASKAKLTPMSRKLVSIWIDLADINSVIFCNSRAFYDFYATLESNCSYNWKRLPLLKDMSYDETIRFEGEHESRVWQRADQTYDLKLSSLEFHNKIIRALSNSEHTQFKDANGELKYFPGIAKAIDLIAEVCIL